MSTSTSRLALVLLSTLLLPSCGDDTPTNPAVPRANIAITVDPAPVPPVQNSLTGTVSIGYRITVTEVNGLGGELQFVASKVYDPETGLLASLTYFDGADLIVLTRDGEPEVRHHTIALELIDVPVVAR